MRKEKGIALLPIGVFLVLYLGLGILFEYVMDIPMGFYNVPIVIAFLAAILVACLQNRALNFDRKLEIMAQGVGDKNIITMLLIFLTSRLLCRSCGKKQRRECCILYAKSHTGQVFSGCFVCCCLLCICGNGDFSRNDYPSDPNRSSSFQCIRI